MEGRADHVVLASFCDILGLSTCGGQGQELGKGEKKHGCGSLGVGKGLRAGRKVCGCPQADRLWAVRHQRNVASVGQGSALRHRCEVWR